MLNGPSLPPPFPKVASGGGEGGKKDGPGYLNGAIITKKCASLLLLALSRDRRIIHNNGDFFAANHSREQ